MIKASWTKLGVAVGGLALSLTVVPVASAQDFSALVNTTCSYPQAVAALNAEEPAAAQRFNASSTAQNWLQRLLASPPEQRQRMVQSVQALGVLSQYAGAVQHVASVCNNY